jgi:mannose/fructose-specific phosphotransferase system component IIA
MSYKKPSNRLAPAVIAGVTIGFLVAAYQLVFNSKKPKAEQKEQEQQQKEVQQEKNQAAEDDQQPK